MKNTKLARLIAPILLIAFVALSTSTALNRIPSAAAAANSDPCATASGTPEQLRQAQQYCDAAKDAEKGAKASRTTAKVWGAVAAFCTVACATQFAPWATPVCEFSSMGAGIFDAVTTKQYAGAIMSIGMTGMTMMNREGSLFKAEGKGARASACMTAATSALQCFTKQASANNSDSSADANLQNARNMRGQATASMSATGGSLSSGKSSNTPQQGSGVASSADASDPCSVANNGGGTDAHISCAVANDAKLPAFVRSPNFPAEFQKVTGANLKEFLSREMTPQTLAQASSGGLTSEGAQKLSSIMGDLASKAGQKFYATDYGGGSYSSGGGGGQGGSASGDSMPDMSAMINGLMAQLNPEDKEELPPGMTQMDFEQLKRAPAQVVEDKSLSIFTRVSYRYYYVGKRVFISSAPRQLPVMPSAAGGFK